jgi:hypothetical protein
MKVSTDKSSPNRLSDAQFEECMGMALRYLKTNTSIRNREIRAVASIGYDQAIYFFNRAISEKRLFREGSGSGTRYVLPGKKDGKR